MQLKRGQELKIEVKFTGEPPPKAAWSKGGKVTVSNETKLECCMALTTNRVNGCVSCFSAYNDCVVIYCCDGALEIGTVAELVGHKCCNYKCVNWVTIYSVIV